MINGVLNVYKEKGYTSHDVVAKLRGILRQKKIGHTGIAGTKKWLDQAVFPCWSNYHTLAGE